MNAQQVYHKLHDKCKFSPLGLALVLIVTAVVFGLCVPFLLRKLRYNKDSYNEMKKEQDDQRR